MVHVTHPQGPRDFAPAGYLETESAGYPDDPYTTPSERPSWPIMLIVGALCIALALLFGRYALQHKDSHPDARGSGSSARPEHPLAGSTLATGAGWKMRVPAGWGELDLSTDGIDAGWTIDRGESATSGAVVVTHRVGKGSTPLRAYAQTAAPKVAATLTDGRVLGVRVVGGHAEMTYAGTSSGMPVRGIGFIASIHHGFAIASLTSLASRFDHDLAQARPFLRTLQGR
jgi:hypothetical protein